jgi:hypothetical protein
MGYNKIILKITAIILYSFLTACNNSPNEQFPSKPKKVESWKPSAMLLSENRDYIVRNDSVFEKTGNTLNFIQLVEQNKYIRVQKATVDIEFKPIEGIEYHVSPKGLISFFYKGEIFYLNDYSIVGTSKPEKWKNRRDTVKIEGFEQSITMGNVMYYKVKKIISSNDDYYFLTGSFIEVHGAAKNMGDGPIGGTGIIYYQENPFYIPGKFVPMRDYKHQGWVFVTLSLD